ncbi:myotilin [Engraulis encrasicolus]|uniref:myotilin n=1 Tax=Engraulis encrasicolus TaxID=184585 RepID=UPI002FD0B6D3
MAQVQKKTSMVSLTISSSSSCTKESSSTVTQPVCSTPERTLSPSCSYQIGVAPTFVKSLHDVSAVAGQLVVLECRLRGTPPLQVLWYREDEQIMDSANFRILRKKATSTSVPEELCTLVITESLPEDSGIFKCMAGNQYGTVSCSCFLEVKDSERGFTDEEEGFSPSAEAELDFPFHPQETSGFPAPKIESSLNEIGLTSPLESGDEGLDISCRATTEQNTCAMEEMSQKTTWTSNSSSVEIKNTMAKPFAPPCNPTIANTPSGKGVAGLPTLLTSISPSAFNYERPRHFLQSSLKSSDNAQSVKKITSTTCNSSWTPSTPSNSSNPSTSLPVTPTKLSIDTTMISRQSGAQQRDNTAVKDFLCSALPCQSSSQNISLAPTQSSLPLRRSPVSPDILPKPKAPTTPQAYTSPTSPQAYPSPTSPQAYPSPTSPQAYPTPTSAQAYTSPTSPQAYPSPTSPQAYPSPTSPQAYTSPTSPQAYPSPTSPQAYTSPVSSVGVCPSPGHSTTSFPKPAPPQQKSFMSLPVGYNQGTPNVLPKPILKKNPSRPVSRSTDEEIQGSKDALIQDLERQLRSKEARRRNSQKFSYEERMARRLLGPDSAACVFDNQSDSQQEQAFSEGRHIGGIWGRQHPGTDGNEGASTMEKCYAPKFLQIPQDLTVEEGRFCRIDFKVVGLPAPDVSWYLDGKAIRQDDYHKMLVSEKGIHSFIIEIVTVHHAGIYECVAKNRAGEGRFSMRIDVNAQEMIRPPTFVMRMQNVRVIEGDMVRLECQVLASPPPQLFWKKDKEMLRIDPTRMSLTQDSSGQLCLLIDQVKKTDAGWYTVSAINEAGMSTCNARLDVGTFMNSAPSHPKPLKIHSTLSQLAAMGFESPMHHTAPLYESEEL